MRSKKPSLKPRPSTVTIKDVAQALGMSVATVSRALSLPERVLPATRERVLSAVDAMGYRPNVVARSLRRGIAPIVLVLVPNLNPFFLEIYRGVEDAAYELGYTVLMGNTAGGEERERVYFDLVTSGQAAGVILLTGLLPADLRRTRMPLPPLVIAGEPVLEPGYPLIGIDHEAEAFAAVSHLLALGHRRIGHIAGPAALASVARREAGWRRALQSADLPDRNADLARGEFTHLAVQSGEDAMRSLLASTPEISAVFAANDELAVGAVRAAQRGGRRVPQDLSVIGMDDQTSLEFFEPALSTVRIPRREIGHQAMLALQRVLTTGRADTGLRLGCELVLRATTARHVGTVG
jgi:LacI family repressor for deo operon, udp, cdd, tsx, nupC, and nupG